jgi:N4-gp56 family major capsid protein
MFSNMFKFALAAFGFGADVVTVSTGTAAGNGNTGIPGNVTGDLQTYFSAKLLEVAERHMVLEQFGEKTPIPSNSSKTIQFVREEKFAVAQTPTQLTEGIPPDAVGLSITEFQAVVEQYGFLVRLSDLAELTAKHPIVQRTMYLLGLQASETYDQLIFNNLIVSTNTYFPNGKASEVSLTASDTLGYNDAVQIEANLQDAAARPFDSGEYVFVVAPQVWASILKDPDWKASHQLSSPDAIWKGEVGALSGMRFVRSNAPAFAAIAQTGSGQANPIYAGFAIGRFAYQISDLQNLRAYVVAPGGQSDPLQQSRKIGWKFAFKTIITNNTWIINTFSAGNNSVNHA